MSSCDCDDDRFKVRARNEEILQKELWLMGLFLTLYGQRRQEKEGGNRPVKIEIKTCDVAWLTFDLSRNRQQLISVTPWQTKRAHLPPHLRCTCMPTQPRPPNMCACLLVQCALLTA
jgi:hypothetical protein